jgi:hypothetical protein
MTFAAGFFGVCVFATLVFLIVAAWREDREDRRARLSNPRSEIAPSQSNSLPPEWDPLADMLEDEALRRD